MNDQNNQTDPKVYIISGRGNGKSLSAFEQMKRYLEDHPDAKIIMPYHHGYSYCKELINSVYGRKKSQHDDMPDAIRYAIEEFDRKQREERLEKAKLTNEDLKRMLNNSHYGVCWPSELIDACERIDRYRKEEEEMDEHRVEPGTIIVANPDYSVPKRDGFWVIGDKVEEFGNTGFIAYRIPDCKASNFMALPRMRRVVHMDCNNWFSIKLGYLSSADSDDIPGWHYATRKEMEEIEDTLGHKFTYNVKTALGTTVRLKFIRNKVDPGVAYTVFVHYAMLASSYDHALNYRTWEELSSRLMYDVCRLINCNFDPLAVDCFSEVLHKAKRVVKYCYCESKENNEEKTVKETTEMNGYKFMVPKGVFGSKVYIQAKDSDKITYAGTMTDMHLETASGCEMHGNVDFIVDDEPVEKLANFNRGFIKNVVFHDPATIVEWKDGSKTVVQARDGEKFDPEKGLAMAISKKAMGNKRDYYHVFKHYLKKVPEQVSVCGEKVKTLTVPEELTDDVMQFLKEKAVEKGEKNET